VPLGQQACAEMRLQEACPPVTRMRFRYMAIVRKPRTKSDITVKRTEPIAKSFSLRAIIQRYLPLRGSIVLARLD
jgi:hypothetical protein